MNFREILRQHHGTLVPGVLLLASHIVWGATTGLVSLAVCGALSAGALYYFKRCGESTIDL